jgi:BNR repeat protein/BNR/Asp-box repeat protein
VEGQPSVPGMPLLPGAKFVSRPSFGGWFLPVMFGWLGAFAILFVTGRSDRHAVDAALLVPLAAGLVFMLLTRAEVEAGQLCVSTWGIRRRCIYLYGLRSVTTRSSRWTIAPTLVLVALDGTRLEIQLGSWRQEEELLQLIYAAAERAHVKIDPRDADIIADLPATRPWALRYLRWRGGIRGVQQVTPSSLIKLAIVFAIGLPVALGVSRVLNVALDFATSQVGVVWETGLFAKHPDSAWVDRFDVPTGPGDTWVGDVALTRGRMAVATREDIQHFWGTVRVRTSGDGGRTWSPAVDVSGPGNAARQSLVAAPDGTLTLAWSQQEPGGFTQQLVVRRSRDGGVSWSAPVVVATPGGGVVGLPAIVTTDTAAVVAFTDGATGEIWAQPLTGDGAPDGPPAKVGTARHLLYSDVALLDGALTIAGTGGHLVLAYVFDADTLAMVLSDDGGRSWTLGSNLSQQIDAGRPRLASDGSTLVLAVVDHVTEVNYSHLRRFVEIQVSHDGGATWQRTANFERAPSVGPLELVWSTGMWRLLYAACPGMEVCVVPGRLWYTTSRDGVAWTEPGVVTDVGPVTPVGIVADESGVSALWATVESEHDWRLSVSRRNE